VVYPDRHAGELGKKNWLMKCTCCGVVCDAHAEFVHAPGCDVLKVATGETDGADFMLRRGLGL
jgi:hypothetical protein